MRHHFVLPRCCRRGSRKLLLVLQTLQTGKQQTLMQPEAWTPRTGRACGERALHLGRTMSTGTCACTTSATRWVLASACVETESGSFQQGAASALAQLHTAGRANCCCVSAAVESGHQGMSVCAAGEGGLGLGRTISTGTCACTTSVTRWGVSLMWVDCETMLWQEGSLSSAPGEYRRVCLHGCNDQVDSCLFIEGLCLGATRNQPTAGHQYMQRCV